MKLLTNNTPHSPQFPRLAVAGNAFTAGYLRRTDSRTCPNCRHGSGFAPYPQFQWAHIRAALSGQNQNDHGSCSHPQAISHPDQKKGWKVGWAQVRAEQFRANPRKNSWAAAGLAITFSTSEKHHKVRPPTDSFFTSRRSPLKAIRSPLGWSPTSPAPLCLSSGPIDLHATRYSCHTSDIHSSLGHCRRDTKVRADHFQDKPQHTV